MESSMTLPSIEGNIRELPNMFYIGKNTLNTLRDLTLIDVSEVIGVWALHKARFWRIVKPFLIQYTEGDEIKTISSFISPTQRQQGIYLLPNEDDRYYKTKILSKDQVSVVHGWDFLALKIQKDGGRFKAYPCLINLKPQVGSKIIEGYKILKHECFNKLKELKFMVYYLRIIFGDDWHFEARFEDI